MIGENTFLALNSMLIRSLSLHIDPLVCCHHFVVGGLCTSMTRIAMLAGVLYSC